LFNVADAIVSSIATATSLLSILILLSNYLGNAQSAKDVKSVASIMKRRRS